MTTEHDDPDGYYISLNKTIPFHIAQWFFRKQINFLNLPTDIAVVE